MKRECKYCLQFDRCPCGCAWGICSDIEQFTKDDDGDGCESFDPNEEWHEMLEFLKEEAADRRREAMREDW